MIKSLSMRAEIALQEVQKIMGTTGIEYAKGTAYASEKIIISVLLEECLRCANDTIAHSEQVQDKAHKITDKIRHVNTALLANLLSMR